MHKHCCKYPNFLPVTHVIFDLDGTIIDSEKVYATAITEALEDLGVKFTDEFFMQIKGCQEKRGAQIAVEYYDLQITPEEFVEKYKKIAHDALANLDLMPATSSTQDSFELKTNKHSELISCFHHIVCGGSDPEVKNGKPSPDIFLIAASRFEDSPRPDPNKCLVFEDSKNGLLAGLAAGMQVVFLPESDILYETWKLATLRLDSFNYFIPELFRLPPFEQDEIALVFADRKIDIINKPIKFTFEQDNDEKEIKTVNVTSSGDELENKF